MPAGSSQQNTISVMLCDDSAVIRGALARVIESDPSINIVSSVANGELAIQAAARHKPDIVILDIEMPVMDGLTALPEILSVSPKSKVIMFSALTEKGASVTLKAFSLGAVECLVKPSSGQSTGEGSEFQRNLLTLIKGFYPQSRQAPTTTPPAVTPPPASASPITGAAQPAPAASAAPTTFSTGAKHYSVAGAPYTLRNDPEAYTGKPSIIAIGSSTGGPQALLSLLKNLDGVDVPIMLTQHMPTTFTKILAEHITQQTPLEAHEGAEGMLVENGKVYVAPGGKHMLLIRENGALKIKLDDGPPENFCKPSVDPMYRSIIEIFGNKVLGVILTGMGSDGLEGGKLLVNKGGRIIAQDKQTSVVWGMPGAVATAGICSDVLPLNDLAPWIKKALLG